MGYMRPRQEIEDIRLNDAKTVVEVLNRYNKQVKKHKNSPVSKKMRVNLHEFKLLLVEEICLTVMSDRDFANMLMSEGSKEIFNKMGYALTVTDKGRTVEVEKVGITRLFDGDGYKHGSRYKYTPVAQIEAVAEKNAQWNREYKEWYKDSIVDVTENRSGNGNVKPNRQRNKRCTGFMCR